MDRFGTGDTYVNYLGEEGPEAVHATYGWNYERLAMLKLKYDPDNFFRFNQNIAPSNDDERGKAGRGGRPTLRRHDV
jgi:hypothetical protein